MKKLFSFLITLVIMSSGSAFAQENIVSLTYSMATPTGNTSAFTSNTSFRGAAIDYRHFINTNMSFGVSFGYQRFYEDKGYTTTSLPGGNGDISGNNYTYINQFPVMATYHYYFGEQGGVRPYVGAGIGAAHYEYQDQYGSVAFVDQQWHFNVAPEAGILIPMGRATYFTSNVKYNYAAAAGGVDSQQYWSFNFGFAFDM